MSYLLGNKICMNSLAADVRDLQRVIVDVISRVGPVPARSWKFLDKMAGDLDIDDLLDLYNVDDDDDDDDPEAKQVGHIALYELVIDRLIFMVQAMSTFCKVQLTAGQQMTTQTADVETKVGGSVGPIVRNYWAHLSKLQTMYQQILQESKLKSMKMNAVEEELSESSAENTKEGYQAISDCKSSTPVTSAEMPGARGLIPPNNTDLAQTGKAACSGQSSQSSISRDTNNKSCQTFETAFVPCDSCDIIQRKLRESGEVIIKVCTDQGLPCSLRKFRNEVSHVEMLSFNDICRWMVEQNKDIARIGKQNEILQASIDPLRADVKVYEKRTKAAEDKVQTFEKNIKEEVDTRVHLRKQYEGKLKEQEKRFKELMEEEERQKSELKKNKDSLEKEMSQAKLELEKQRDILRDLEINYKTMEHELEEKKHDAERAAASAKEVADLKSKLADVTATLDSHSKTMAREQGKSRSASKHNEKLQAKQDALLARMDLLGMENEDLAQQVASLEEEKISLQDALCQLKVEARELRAKVTENEIIINNLEKEKSKMQKSMQETEAVIQSLEVELKEAKERERMIVEYPDLNGPVNSDLLGTGDVVVDMQNQVTANTIRIRLLEEQNQSLSQSVHKLSALRSGSATKKSPVKLVPLWQNNSGVLNNQRNNNSNFQDSHQGALLDYICDNLANSERPEHISHLKPKQYAWTHTKKEEELPNSFPGSGLQIQHQEFLISRGNTPQHLLQKEEKLSKQRRPLSAKMSAVMAPVNATPIGAYVQMRKAFGEGLGKDKTKGRPLSGKHHRDKIPHKLGVEPGLSKTDDSTTPVLCPRCDKMYLNSRDLEIHLTYCSR